MKRPPGQLRLSQLVTTYGPGAPVDLPDYSVLVGGLSEWHPLGRQIAEPRLVRKIRALFQLDGEVRLHAPPIPEQDPETVTGVGTWLFPEWFQTVDIEFNTDKKVRSRRLVHLRQLEGTKYFVGEDRKKSHVVPIRFVRACIHGHIADIDWRGYVHGGNEPCARSLFIDERGTSGDVSEILVRCACGQSRLIKDATIPGTDVLGKCDGPRPWLGRNMKEGCDQRYRLLVRSASNAYFTQPLTVISLPEREERLQKAIEPVWETFLQYVESKEEFARDRERKHQLKQALAGLDTDAMWAAIEARRKGTVGADRDVKDVEFELLADSQHEVGTDIPDGDYFARSIPVASAGSKHAALLEKVVLVHRLREVQAIVGFTRFESSSPDIHGELEVGVKRAALSETQEWFPAVETRGEGVFLHFKTSAVEAWAKRPGVVARANALVEGFDSWKADHKQSARKFCGVEYELLHSLSHLLITAVSLGCGYPASSIRERIYALPGLGYGILLYTASSDAEGTLGGLVEVGRRIGRYLDEALDAGGLCSNDPVCAQHDPKNEHEQRFLHGAACHGCVLISETSCEQRNDFLDRALVVPTVDVSDAAFFVNRAP